MRIADETLYMTDNGRTVCGKHLGASARHTGRDLSGQSIMAVTPEVAQVARDEYGYIPECEDCGKKASLLHV